MTHYGKVEIAESHEYSASVHGFRISPHLQNLMTYLGSTETYSDANCLINKFLNIEINSMQVHRVTNVHGDAMENALSEAEAEALKSTVQPDEVVYGLIDGAMVLTREEGWKEVKTIRLFGSAAALVVSESRRALSASLYCSHLGTKDDFLEKVEPMTDVFDDLGARFVFVTDGAKWIGNWVQSTYPKATSILDVFHFLEHLNEWLLLEYKDSDARKLIFNQYKECVLTGGGTALFSLVSAHTDRTKAAEEERKNLLKYLNNNLFRMDYPAYLARGLFIGSGAIESAQRTVLQQRLKLSGQRWTMDKAQNVLNLRTARLSNYWDKVITHIRTYKNTA